MTRFSRLVALAGLALAACTPYQPPALLSATAGPAVQIADGRFTSEAFSLRVPPGWRVITPPAAAPPSVILAGEGCQLIMVGESALDNALPRECADVPLLRLSAQAAGDVPVEGVAAQTESQAFSITFRAVVRSVAAPAEAGAG